MLTTSQVPYSLRLGHDCPGHPGEFIRERDGATLAGALLRCMSQPLAQAV